MKIQYLFPLLLLVASSCRSFENQVQIELPEYERQLVVECYLEPGKPYRLVLSESVGFFDSFAEFPFVSGAVCVIEHNGVRDTLTEAPAFPGGPIPFLPYFNEAGTKFYNYASTTLCPLDYDSDFSLYIRDPQGRTITATTRILPPVQLDKLEPAYTIDSSQVSLLMKFQDDGTQTNFYRPVAQRTTLDSLPILDFAADDGRFLNGEYVVFGSRPGFERGDTIVGTLYHIDRAYYDFLLTVNDAIQSNGSPFAQPGRILGNVEGGIGIFTFISYDRDTLYVP
jgi:hypothetical protein